MKTTPEQEKFREYLARMKEIDRVVEKGEAAWLALYLPAQRPGLAKKADEPVIVEGTGMSVKEGIESLQRSAAMLSLLGPTEEELPDREACLVDVWDLYLPLERSWIDLWMKPKADEPVIVQGPP